MRRRRGRPVSFIILGVLFLIGGLFYGTTSRQVTFEKFNQGTIAHYISNGGTNSSNADDHLGYLQMENNNALFLVHEQNFSPAIHGIDTFKDGQIISFYYDASTTTDINVKSSLSELKGSASEVVEILSIDQSAQTEYTSELYRTNHTKYYKNTWPAGLGVAGFGVVLALLGFFLVRRRKAAATQQAVYMAPQQPYQSPAQYPGNEQYSGQPSQPGFYPPAQQPGQYPAQQPGQYPPQQPGQYPAQQPGQYPAQQPGQYPPQQPGQYPPTQYPAYPPQPGQYEPTRPADPYQPQ